jgi:phenylalanyl-tRNA synthetase beta chain
MRVPLSWLRDYIDVDLEPEPLAERLTLLGMEVQGIERFGADWRSVVVGELLEVEPHPGTAKLSLTKVITGEGNVLSIACGATNIAVGQRVPVALPGAVLPGDRRIEVARIAGEESQGMLCSGAELGLTTDADGILILPADTPVGARLEDLLGDVVLDVDVKPNRGDALSMIGLAREVAAATGAPLHWPEIAVEESGDETADHLAVEVEDPALCPRFVGRWVDGLTVGPSPADVQRRLLAAGMRPISNIVDASNYVMHELGKPIHTFDAAAVHGRIVVRRAREGERIETLDHVVRELHPDVLLIADPEGPIGIAGVMGGAASEVADTTTAVVIESAIFDPVSIRRTAFRYALRSEASLRFEKGQEHRLARLGADRTAQLILRWAGGRAATGVIDTEPEEPAPARVPFRPARVSRLLGIDIDPGEQRGLLGRVEVATETGEQADELVAVVPSHRRDLQIEADIAEEVARVRGFETVPGHLPDTEMPSYRPDPRRFADQVRALISARGWLEVMTHGLVSPDDHARLGLPPDDPATIRAANPVTLDHSELRRSMLPGHLHVLADSERQRRPDLRLYEVGPIHRWEAGRPVETAVLGLLATGRATPPGWQDPERPLDLGDVKGLLEWLADRMGGARLLFEPAAVRAGIEHPGRTAAIVVDLGSERMALGRVGELHPDYLAAMDVRAERVVFAEIPLAGLRRLEPAHIRIGIPERLPVIERDIAVVVGTDRRAGEVLDAIVAAGGSELREVRLFDRYQGPPLAEREVSLAWRLRFQAGDSAFADDEVDQRIGTIVGVLSERVGARLRA